jgi:hypothetical protein
MFRATILTAGFSLAALTLSGCDINGRPFSFSGADRAWEESVGSAQKGLTIHDLELATRGNHEAGSGYPIHDAEHAFEASTREACERFSVAAADRALTNDPEHQAALKDRSMSALAKSVERK